MLDDRDDEIDNEPIEETHSVQIGDVVVDRVGFKDIDCALVTLTRFLEQMPIDDAPIIESNQKLQKEKILVCTSISSN